MAHSLTPAEHRGEHGFTLMELMVVISIIIIASGLMVPSFRDFIRNRALDGVRLQTGTTLGSARLQAVANSSTFSVVFFSEGVRIYDAKNWTWLEGEDFDPTTSPAAADGIHVDLPFAGIHGECPVISGAGSACVFINGHGDCIYGDTVCLETTDNLPRYEDWWWMVQNKQGSGAIERSSDGEVLRFSVDGLIRLDYSRDGMMSTVVPAEVWVYDGSAMREEPHYNPPISTRVRRRRGNDVPYALFKNAEGADILIWQRGNESASFIDLQATGTVNTKTAFAQKILDKVIVEEQ